MLFLLRFFVSAKASGNVSYKAIAFRSKPVFKYHSSEAATAHHLPSNGLGVYCLKACLAVCCPKLRACAVKTRLVTLAERNVLASVAISE